MTNKPVDDTPPGANQQERSPPPTPGDEPSPIPVSVEPGASLPNEHLEPALLHELSLYQLELDAQNQQLRDVHADLEESRARFRDLYADAPLAFFTIGIQGRILGCNRRAAELLRLTVPSASRRRITEFMTAQAATLFTRQVALLYRTRRASIVEFEMRRSDGKPFWAELTMSLAGDDETARVCQLSIADISERKRMQDDAARLVAIVASSAQAIISADPDGTITSWNAGAERLFDFPAAQAVGHNISMVVPTDRVAEDQEIREKIRRREPVGLETVRQRADGSPVPVFVSAAPIVAPTGRVTGISFIVRDITEQVEAKQKVAQLLEDLREADRRKDDFLAMLAHELRNPLAPIRNAAAVMRFAGDLSPKLQWSRDVIDRQVAHMAALLEDLLDVSRLARNKITLHKDLVDLGIAIAQAVEVNRPMIEGRGHRLTMELTPEPIQVDGDLTRLIQTFGNLLNNAAKYTDPGGEISIKTAIAGDQVLIRISDSGIGIRPENLRSIFDLFAQVEPSREGAEGGLGIGLALVKGLVERHGGNIVARSSGLGQGSEFIVCLPLAQRVGERGGTERPGDSVEDEVAKPLQVLVADDNVDAAESLAIILQAHHHHVRTAHDGEEAFELAAKRVPDAMLVDLGMPRLNGYDLARRVRAEPWGRNTVLIACTGWGQPEDRRRSEEAGFDYHLVKPVSPTTVLRLLQSLDLARAH